MKVSVDPNLCSQCGLCVEIAPDVFKMGEESAEVAAPDVPPELQDDVTEAVEGCPEAAISLVE